jgi:hypothetical protein
MENLTTTTTTLDSLSSTSGTATTNTLNIDKIVFDTLHYSTSTSSTHNLYSTPVLIDTIVTKDYIELVYKRQYMVSNNWGMPNPEIFKDVYSRHGGDVRRVIGTYIPAQSESYEFEE